LLELRSFDRSFPDLKIRFVNVVDLCRLQPDTDMRPLALASGFDCLFTKDIDTSAE